MEHENGLNWCYGICTNDLMKMMHGNGQNYIDFMYQNIPGILNQKDIIISIETILSSKSPALLGIAEPMTEQLDIDWSNYSLVKGKANNCKKRILW